MPTGEVIKETIDELKCYLEELICNVGKELLDTEQVSIEPMEEKNK